MSGKEIDDRAQSLANLIAQAYEAAARGNTTGLHNNIAAALRPGLFVSSTEDKLVRRVNTAIEQWERRSMRQPGPRLITLNEATGKVDVR